MAAFPSVSVLFSHYPDADVGLHNTGLLLKVITEPAKGKASALPPCGTKAAKDSLPQIPSLLLQGMGCGGDGPCPLGILTGRPTVRLIGECWNQQEQFW